MQKRHCAKGKHLGSFLGFGSNEPTRQRCATSRTARRFCFESLEQRQVFAAPTLGPILDQDFLSGAPIQIALAGQDADSDPLTFSATSDNPNIFAEMRAAANRYLVLDIAHTSSGQSGDADFSGQLIFQLFEDLTPVVTSRIISLVNQGFYDSLIFHRIINTFVIQGGDPQGDGTGGSGVEFDDQYHVDLQHTVSGLLSMAKSSDDSNDSQFFITEGPQRNLDFNHSIFGMLVAGESFRDQISNVPTDTDDRPFADVTITGASIQTLTTYNVLTVKAAEGFTGSGTITVTVSDGNGGTAQQTFTVNATPDPTDNRPFLINEPTQILAPAGGVAYQFESENVDGGALAYYAFLNDAADSNKVLISINKATGLFTATPVNGFTGLVEIFVVASPLVDADHEFIAQQAATNSVSLKQAYDFYSLHYDMQTVPIVVAPALLTLSIPTASNITSTTATLGGNVSAGNGVTISERGFVYALTSLNSNPQIFGTAVSQIATGGTRGSFTIDVSGLPAGSQISFAAYATSDMETVYSPVSTFTTQSANALEGITVQILNGAMVVTGTEQDDTIQVATDGSGGFIVTANQSINGLPSPQTFTGATSFVANTLGGHDDLWLAAPLTLNSVTVDLGNGNDHLVLGADPNIAINNDVTHAQFGTLGYLTVNGPVNVTGGEGNDRVIERSTAVNGVKTISLGEGDNEYNVYWGFSNETIFLSGNGQDSVHIGYLNARQISQYYTGAGNDLISFYGNRFYKTVHLNTGAGHDTAALDVNLYDGVVTVDTGSDADYLLFSRSVAHHYVSLITGSGDDTVLIGKYISGIDPFGRAIYRNGGSNIQQLTLNTNEGADRVQIAANAMRQFFANLGTESDDAEVEYNLFTAGLLDGGEQTTRLRQRGNSNLRTRNTVAG